MYRGATCDTGFDGAGIVRSERPGYRSPVSLQPRSIALLLTRHTEKGGHHGIADWWACVRSSAHRCPPPIDPEIATTGRSGVGLPASRLEWRTGIPVRPRSGVYGHVSSPSGRQKPAPRQGALPPRLEEISGYGEDSGEGRWTMRYASQLHDGGRRLQFMGVAGTTSGQKGDMSCQTTQSSS